MTTKNMSIFADDNDDGSSSIFVEIPDEYVERYEFRVDDDGLTVERFGDDPAKCLGTTFMSWDYIKSDLWLWL